MGTRAVITSAPYGENNVGIYVHWNGGRASVEAFILAAKKMGFRPVGDNYGWARLTQLITNFFGCDGTSIGVDICKNLDTDNGDNGTYLLDPNEWKIVGREFHSGAEQDDYNVEKMADDIVEKTRRIEREKESA